MKLWVAPQSRRASNWVVLCHMLTVKEIVIEFFWVLYMLATVARVLATIKLCQTKNPGPCHVCHDLIIWMDYFFFVIPSYFPFVPLLSPPFVPDSD